MQPYATQAKRLNDLVLDYQMIKKARRLTLAQIGTIFGGASPSTVRTWLEGEKKPRRAQAVRIAEGLIAAGVKIDDRFAIARLYGHGELDDATPASIDELIDYVGACDELPQDRRAIYVSRLHLAAEMHNRYDREVIAQMLRMPYPLLQRAQRLAEYADLATSHPLLAVA